MANEHLSKTMVVKFDGEAIARTTSFSFEINKETVDITSLDSDGWKEFLVDLKEMDVSFDALVVRQSASDSKKDYEELLNSLITSDTAVTVLIDDSAASTDISFSAFLIGLSLSGSLGDKQTFSGTIKPTGAATVA